MNNIIDRYGDFKNGVSYGWESCCYKIQDLIINMLASGCKHEKIVFEVLSFCLNETKKAKND